MFNNKIEKFYIFSFISGVAIILFVTYPIINTFTWTSFDLVIETLKDKEVISVILRSLKLASYTTAVAFLFSIPFAYFVVRYDFPFKNLLESIIDIPMVMPHTVAGIALLTVLSPKSGVGAWLKANGIEVLGTEIAVVIAMLFVSLPLMFNAAKDAFKWIPIRLENVSRSLGASHFKTFIYITFPLAWRDILSGMIITWARAISEFGAVIILAYHPMIAPTLIYERYTTYGMTFAVPVTVILLMISLTIFLLLKMITIKSNRRRVER